MTDLTLRTEPPLAAPYLNTPLHDLAAWVRYFSRTEIPVLAATGAGIERLREYEDDVLESRIDVYNPANTQVPVLWKN